MKKYELNAFRLFREKMISGLTYYPYFLSDTEQTHLLENLSNLTHWMSVGTSENSRKVIHFGSEYKYRTSVEKARVESFPDWIQSLKQKIVELEEIPKELPFNQCIVNQYLPRQGIHAHIDDPRQFTDFVVCFTLGSSGTIIFQKENEKIELFVKQGSLYIMSGEARFEWKHSMVGRKFDTMNGKKSPVALELRLPFEAWFDKDF